ncbi:MAG: SPOR domain-containing protein [Bacteroidales bacterium]|nr:SPOR domain-containing protein [Bacteroidales bacterium]
MKATLLINSRLLFLIFLLAGLNALGQKGIPDDFCLSNDEYRLYEMINAHRVLNGLKEIPLSASLSYVARTHVIDLYTNHPDTSICNLNSWSDKGSWTPCCHNKYVPQEECIRNKPKELTGYTGEGYELTYAEVFNTRADTVFKFWSTIDEANEFLLNEGRWEKKNWRAIGIGIYKSYAVVWMGQKTDALPAPERCSGVSASKTKNVRNETSAAIGSIPVISSKTGRFYLIVASLQSDADAQKEATKYSKLEGTNIMILKNMQGQYRVSINDYPTLEEAKQGKTKFEESFKGAWILNY